MTQWLARRATATNSLRLAFKTTCSQASGISNHSSQDHHNHGRLQLSHLPVKHQRAQQSHPADTTRSTASGNNRPPFPITTTFWNKKVSNTHPPRALLQHCEERYNSIFLSRGKHQVIDSLLGSRLSQACIGGHDWQLADNSATWLEKSRAEPS